MKIVYLGNQLQHKGLSPTTIDTLSIKLRQLGYEVETFSKKNSLLLRLLDMIRGILKNKNASVVLIDTYSTKAFVYAICATFFCQVLKIKYIPYLHGGNLPTRLKKNPKICRWIFSNSFINIAPSPYLQNAFVSNGFSNTILIPNTLEIKEYSFLLREPLVPKILWVRAFAEIYNPKLAVDVLIEIKKIYPKAELCMVGPEKDGSLELTKQYASTKNVSITFTGKLSKKEWVKLSKNYNLFLNTTNFDNTPVSVIEAMALGLPIVTTNVGGLPFLLTNQENAILVPPKNAVALADKMVQLVKDPIKYKKIATNARFTAEQWDWEVVKKQWIKLFEKVK